MHKPSVNFVHRGMKRQRSSLQIETKYNLDDGNVTMIWAQMQLNNHLSNDFLIPFIDA